MVYRVHIQQPWLLVLKHFMEQDTVEVLIIHQLESAQIMDSQPKDPIADQVAEDLITAVQMKLLVQEHLVL